MQWRKIRSATETWGEGAGACSGRESTEEDASNTDYLRDKPENSCRVCRRTNFAQYTAETGKIRAFLCAPLCYNVCNYSAQRNL